MLQSHQVPRLTLSHLKFRLILQYQMVERVLVRLQTLQHLQQVVLLLEKLHQAQVLKEQLFLEL